MHTIDILQAKSKNIAAASLQTTTVRASGLLRWSCAISHREKPVLASSLQHPRAIAPLFVHG